MSEPPRVHVPGRELDDRDHVDQARNRPPRPRVSGRPPALHARFVLRIRVEAESPAGLWRRARRVEQLARELAPAGTEVEPVELVGRQGHNGRKFRQMMRQAGRSASSWPAPRPAVGSAGDSSQFVPPQRRTKGAGGPSA